MAVLPVSHSELLARQARRNLWLAFAVVALIALAGVAVLVAPSVAGLAWRGLPVVIVIVIAVVAARTAWPAGRTGEIVRLMRTDELRHQSVALACRDGLLGVLCAQPLLLGLTVALSVASPAAVMACGTALVGIATFLASLLVRDR